MNSAIREFPGEEKEDIYEFLISEKLASCSASLPDCTGYSLRSDREGTASSPVRWNDWYDLQQSLS